MTPGEQVALEPALHLMLAEHLHDPPVDREAFVGLVYLRDRHSIGHLEHRPPAVGRRLVGPEDTEVAALAIELQEITDERALHLRCGAADGAAARNIHGVLAKVRQAEVLEQEAAVGVRVGAHAPCPRGRERGELGSEAAVLVKQLLGTIAAHPPLEQRHVVRLLEESGERHLVRAPRPFHELAVHFARACPALGRAQNDHRPSRTLPPVEAARTRRVLDPADLVHHGVERGRQCLVHRRGLVAFDEIRRVAVASKERVELLAADAREHRRSGDLVAVEVQDRQHGAVVRRIEELVGVPGGGQRPRLRLAVADDAGDEQVGVVEGGAVRVRQGVAELAAFVHRARRLGRVVAWNAAGEGELGEESLQARFILGDLGIDLAVRAFEVRIGDEPGASVTRPGDIDHAQIARLDHTVEVRVDEIQPRRRAEVAEEPPLDVSGGEPFLQERIVVEVDLADREIIRGAPVGVDLRQFLA